MHILECNFPNYILEIKIHIIDAYDVITYYANMRKIPKIKSKESDIFVAKSEPDI